LTSNHNHDNSNHYGNNDDGYHDYNGCTDDNGDDD
jgi:hypothetical protein